MSVAPHTNFWGKLCVFILGQVPPASAVGAYFQMAFANRRSGAIARPATGTAAHT